MPPSLLTALRALRHANYRRWAVADFVSVTGAWMQNLALNWFVLTKTGSPTLLGISVLFQAVPGILLASWAGAIADRFPARGVLFVTQGLHALLALALAAAAWLDGPLAAIYVVGFLGGVVTVFDGPALGRFGAQMVAREDLSNALSLGSIFSSGGRILGMSLAGSLVGITGVPWLFVLNAASFGGVLLALSRVRSATMFPLARSAPDRAGVKAGLRYVLGHRPLIVMFLLGFVLSSLGRNYQVTMAAMSEGPLGAGATGYSVLSTVFAVGTVIGGVLAAARRELTVRLLLATALLTSVVQVISGSAMSLWTFAAALLPIAAGAVIIDTTMSTRIQLDSDEDMRGRVLAAKGMVTAASGAVGGPLLGWLAEQGGPGRALEVAGVVTVAATGVGWLVLSRLTERRAMPAAYKWSRLAMVSEADGSMDVPAEPAAVPARPSRESWWSRPGKMLRSSRRSPEPQIDSEPEKATVGSE